MGWLMPLLRGQSGDCRHAWAQVIAIIVSKCDKLLCELLRKLETAVMKPHQWQSICATDYIVYTYDAGGRKLTQQVFGSTPKTTDYLGEFIYENNVLQFINHEEGRVVMTGAPEYQYHLKDHLGNVRTTFTSTPVTDNSTATYETSNAAVEQGQYVRYTNARFVNATLFNHTPGGSYSERLSGSAQEKYGLAKSISVMPGDVINAEVYAKYVDPVSSNWTPALASLMSQITTAAAGVVVDGTGYPTSTSSFPYAGLNNTTGSTGGPKAYLNWLIFDRNYVLITGGYQRLSATPKETGSNVAHERLACPAITINQPGYVYIYLSNEETTAVEVYFDDFKVTQAKSAIVQQDEYYPGGATFNSYVRENSGPQKYLYNGKEYQEDLGLNLHDSHWRQYDPWILRTITTDPHAEKYYELSSYTWCANNPVNVVDPDGREIEEGSKKEWDKQKAAVTKERDRLQGKVDKLTAKAQAKGWSAEKLANRTGNLTQRVASLNGSIKTLGALESSKQVYALNKIGAGQLGGLSLDPSSKKITINFAGTANFVHETTHGGQFENGELAFSSAGQLLGQDVYDEAAAYKAQFGYDPSSVSGLTSTSVANSFGSITTQWVQGIQEANGNRPYAPGGTANTGLTPVNINSNRNALMQAYPNASGVLGGLSESFRLQDTPGIYYKH